MALTYQTLIDDILLTNAEQVIGIGFQSQNSEGDTESNFRLYLTINGLFKFIENDTVIFGGNDPLLKLNYSFKPCLALSISVSNDLRKCYIYNNIIKTNTGEIIDITPYNFFNSGLLKQANINTNLKKYTNGKDYVNDSSTYPVYPQVGDIGSIYLDFSYLSNIISERVNNSQDGKISLKEFLQKICDDLNRCLGGINNIQPYVDPDTNELTLIDYNAKQINELVTEYSPNAVDANIIMHGLGTFVTNLNVETAITSEMASLISIGAQANANLLGENATTFSKLSFGLEDRIQPIKTYSTGSNKNNSTNNPNDLLQKNINTFIKNILEPQKQSPIPLTDNDFEKGSITIDIFKHFIGYFTEEDSLNTTFIPLKLSLDMLGISGIKLFQKFTSDTNALPYDYRNNYDFLITGIEHNIGNNNRWDTTLNALVALKPPTTSSITNSSFEITTSTLSSLNTISPSATTSTTYSPSQALIGGAVDACVANTPKSVSGFSISSGVRRRGTGSSPQQANGNYHGALDINTPEGTKLAFNIDTILVRAYASKSYGNTVFLKQKTGSNTGFEFRFAHLKEISDVIKKAKPGDTIPSGTLLGLTGNTGFSQGPHLHFEIRNPSGRQVCPNDYAVKFIKLG